MARVRPVAGPASALDQHSFSCNPSAMTHRRITREAAHAAGLTRYFTGKPCNHGHVVERYVAEPGSCVECLRLRNRKPKWRQRRKAWANSDHPAARAHNRFKGQKNAARIGGFKQGPHEKDCPPRSYNGVCQRCHKVAASHKKKPAGAASLVMDHNHKTGAFRGWLCAGCNVRVERVDDELTRAYLNTVPGGPQGNPGCRAAAGRGT